MIYGSRTFKNGKRVGYLEFTTGKKIYLNVEEKAEFEYKIKTWQEIAVEQERENEEEIREIGS